MEPEVRYCTTSDGVRIAYTVTGEGPPVVCGLNPVGSHVQLEWSHPVFRLYLAALARNNTLIRFDLRGCGLSDLVMAQTPDEFVLDIEAVVARTGFERFALAASEAAVPVAILFASRHPEQVTHMVFWDGFVRWSDFVRTPQARALGRAAAADWTTRRRLSGPRRSGQVAGQTRITVNTFGPALDRNSFALACGRRWT